VNEHLPDCKGNASCVCFVKDEPRDPFSPLMNAAVQMHEMVLQFVQAGFTRKEAIHIMLTSLKNTDCDDDDDEDPIN
jgi:hypothetical protein